MNVTINTDASFSHKHKAGGYAFWIVCDKGRIKSSGTLKEALNPQDCEMKCLANALHTLQKSEFNDGSISMIIVNSDCLYMFEKIGLGKGHPEVGKFIAKKFKSIFKNNPNERLKNKKRYILKHVKAHTNDLTQSRSWVNNWCDKEAKKAMIESVNIKN